MTTDTQLAFDHPLARSKATAKGRFLDRISVRDHIEDVEIGAFQVERDLTQRLKFNVVVEVRPVTATVDDDVDRILSYDRITEAITGELAAERLNLLETLADRIAARILHEPQAQRCFVRIEKLDRGTSDLGVEIVRTADDFAQLDDADAPQPLIVHLDATAMTSLYLSGWLDALAHDPRPVVLTVPKPEVENVPVKSSRAQRNIDLLAIEQNAWRMSAADARLVVVGSLTELDWGMKNGQLSVWAPSKMVLDAVNGPENVDDIYAWFASEMNASAELTVDANAATLDL